MKYTILLLFIISSVFASKSCFIKSSPILLIIDNNISNHDQLINDTNCKKEILEQFMAIATNASGILSEKKLNLYLKSVNTKIKLRPNAINIYQMDALLRKKNIINKDVVIRDIKQLSNNKVIHLKELKYLHFTCGDCKKTGSKNIKITFRTKSDNEKNLWITLDLLRKRFALIAKKTINPFVSKLNKTMFKKVEVPMDEGINLFQDIKNIEFYQTNKSIAVGQVIKSSDLTPSTLVRAGRKVKVLINKKNIQLKTIAVSRSIGKLGDLIEVYNPNTKKKFLATVIDENIVEVKL